MSYFAKRSGRIVAGMLSGALALSVTPILGFAGIASAAPLPAVANPIGAGAFCENMPTTEPFTDVSSTDPSIDEIICLVNTGLTTGTTATTYSPNASITRRQMALFIKRMADLANSLEIPALTDLPAYDGTPDFTDIAGESTATQAAIGQLNQAGIVQGTSGTNYSPGAPVSRRQMAAFVNRLENFLTGASFSTTNDYFNDDTGDTGEANLNALASVGIFQGDGAGNVNPGGDLTRRQMANILLRHAQVLFANGDIGGAFPGTSNQTFTVTPAAAATNAISTSSVDDTGRRTFSADVTGATVDIALFPAENVTNTSGVISFADVAAPANQADWTATNAVIELVNGSIAGANSGYVDNVTVPGSGTVTFAIDSLLADEVIPVLFTNATASGTPVLALDAADEPTVAFGIGGQTNWIPAEAGGGAFPAAAVEQLNRTTDFFVGDPGGASNGPSALDLTFNYDANDVFKFTGTTISMSQFEGLLTGHPLGDVVNVFYDPNPANTSTFNVTTDNVAAASSVVATPGDFDADSVQDDVRITWTASTQPDAVYDVVRQLGVVCNSSSPLVEGNSTDTTSTDLNAPAGTWTYCVYAKGATSGSLSPVAQVDGVVTPPVLDTTGAHVVREGAAVDTDAGTTGTADTSDVFMLLFDEPVTPASGATLAVTGTSGGSTNVQNGVNATFANVDATTVSVTLTQPLVGTGPLTFPLTITAAAGLPDAAGNATIFGNWQDVSLETDGPEFATDTLTPFTGAQSRVVSATQIVLVFNEALAPLSVDTSCLDFTITTGTCAAASVSGRTVTLTGVGFVAGTTMVAISGTVTDTEGQSTATQAATVIPAA